MRALYTYLQFLLFAKCTIIMQLIAVLERKRMWFLKFQFTIQHFP